MIVVFKDNPNYQLIHTTANGTDLYAPADQSQYHLSRYVAANAQNIYSACGTTKETLTVFLNEMVKRCNDAKDTATIRTDIAILANNLLYRIKYPVDEDCAIRMGAIYCFIDGEDPEDVSDMWTRKKMELAKSAPATYSFFLTLGIRYTPSWNGLDSPLTSTDYLTNRDTELAALSPQ